MRASRAPSTADSQLDASQIASTDSKSAGGDVAWEDDPLRSQPLRQGGGGAGPQQGAGAAPAKAKGDKGNPLSKLLRVFSGKG